jgi:hypothetical protein
MKGLFQVLVNGDLKTYYRYEDIPKTIDHLIRFEPEIPEGPHTDEEHEWIESLPQYMNEIMNRESKSE